MKNILKKILKKFLFKKKIDTVETDHYYPKKLTKYNKIIPNNFFQTYKSKTVDIEYNKKIKEFRDKNPSFNYYFFDDIDCEKFMEKHWGHRKIYEIIENLNTKGMIANPITLKNFFENENGLSDVGGVDYLIKLTRFSSSTKQAILST